MDDTPMGTEPGYGAKPGQAPPRPPIRDPWDGSRLVNRVAPWVIAALVVGFMLPVCLCWGTAMVFFNGLASLGLGGAVNEVPVEVTGEPAIALIRLEGVIVDDVDNPYRLMTLSPSYVDEALQWAEDNPDVRAIVLRVDSPGGSANASDEIWHRLTEVDMPVVVSVGGLCASGCYYFSSAADRIIAAPNSLTGSIGVISTFINAEGLLEQVGIEFNVVTTGNMKDFGSPFRDMTDEEIEYWRGVISEAYRNFVGVVAEGRNLSESEVRRLADGRVYTTDSALELGLIDAEGYLEDAITQAAELAGVPGTARVLEYTPTIRLGDLIGMASASPFISGFDPARMAMSLQSPIIEYRYIGQY